MENIIDITKYERGSDKESLNYCVNEFLKSCRTIKTLEDKKFALFRKYRMHRLISKHTEIRIATLAYIYLLDNKHKTINKAVMAAATVIMVESDHAPKFYNV